MKQAINTAGISKFNGFLDLEVMQLYSEEVIYIEPLHK